MTARTKLRTPRPALLALLPLALLTSCMAPAPPPEPGADSIRASAPGEIPDPYAEGASFAGRYRIESVERHPEYTRLYFSGPEGESGVEIVRDSGAPTAWSANGHRVQPAPESSPPMELLEAVLAQLEIAAPSRLRSSALAGHGRGADPSIRGQTLAALAATGLAALLWIVLFGFWLREHRAWRLEATLWIGLVSFAAIGWGLLGPASIPVEHMTVLHETNLGNLLGTLLAIDLHAGPYFAELAGALTRLGWLPLRA
ncbi:MAG: hypothetical protein OEY14_10340, partial [Myxococcales bacterium]|nr:hypothetical protein [Myxococcales bacterium]